MPAPENTTQDMTQPQTDGAGTDMQDQDMALMQQQMEVKMRAQAILQTLQQNPQLGDIKEFMQKMQAVNEGLEERAQALQKQQEEVQQQIMQYQPQGQESNEGKKGWIEPVVTVVSAGILSAAAMLGFQKGPKWISKKSDWLKGGVSVGGGVVGGQIIGILARRMSGGKKEEKEEKGIDAEQIVLAMKNNEQDMRNLMVESLQGVSRLCDEYEAQIKTRMQQMPAPEPKAPEQSASPEMDENSPAIMPVQAPQAMPQASVPPQPPAPPQEMMNENTTSPDDNQAFASPASVQVGAVQQAGMRSPAGREMARQQEGADMSQDR